MANKRNDGKTYEIQKLLPQNLKKTQKMIQNTIKYNKIVNLATAKT
jgi:hypothetical protein